jgi:hypothetical protein
MAEVVNRLLLTSKFRVCARANPYGICGGQSETRAHFSPRYSISPMNIIPP